MGTQQTSTNLRDWFEQALLRPPAERAAFVATCADADTRARLARMLAADERDEDVPGGDAQAIASRLGDVDHLRQLPPGCPIGPFELLEVLGEGGSSTVFRAARTHDGVRQQVALKLLRRGLYTPDAQRQFRRERLALAQLQHPGIARLIEGGVTETGLAYIALELVDGQPITEHARAHRLDLRARLRLFLKVCRAVEAAHRALIVHRDLKPSNVLVTPDGEVKLLDFGIAKLLEGEDETQTRLPAFTPAYAAPEQKHGGLITTATDVYALGVLLGELMTGERLADGSHTPSGRVDDRHAPGVLPAPPRVTRRLLRGDLDNIVLKALDEDSARRYASAGMFADDVERLLDGRPVVAHPPSRWYRTRKFIARHKGGVATTLAFLLAVLAALGVALRQAHVARREAQRANAMRDFMVAAFEEAQPGAPRDGPPRITEVVEQALASARADLRMDPRVRAELVSRLGAVLSSQGDIARAREVLQWNHDSARAGFGDDARETLDTGHHLADALILDGDYAAARTLLDRLLAHAPGGDAGIDAALRLDSARLASKQHELDRAIADADEGMRQMRRLGDDIALERALDEYGNVRLAIGDVTGAIAAWKEALALRERRFGAAHIQVAASHAALSRAYRRDGRLDEAERHIRAALAIDAAVLPAEHWRRANHLNALTMVQYARRDFRAALGSATESLRIHRALFGDGDHPEIANDINSVGMMHALLEDWPAALPLLREALERHVAAFGPEHPETASTRANYGLALAGAGGVAAGEAELRHAIASLENAAEADPDEQAVTWEKLARVRLDRGDAAGALRAIDRIDALLAEMDAPGTYWDGRAAALRASALLADGRAADARPLLDSAAAALAASKNADAVLRVEVPLLDAAARLALGERDAARTRAALDALAGLRHPPRRLAVLARRLGEVSR
jgi:serine/threonine-protein kinase